MIKNPLRACFGKALAAGFAALACLSTASASTWPSGAPIKIVVGFAPGGPTDIVARVLARQLAEQLKNPVVVENRAGANGNVAADVVAKSKPDGNTFLYNSSSLTISPALYKSLPFDTNTSFSFVGGAVAMPSVLVVKQSLPPKSIPEWVDYVRANKGRLNYGSPGTGNSSHLAVAWILDKYGLEAVHIPYKGSAEAKTALLAGQTQFQVDSINASLPLIRSGQLRALAVLSSKRAVDLPNVPTIGEFLPGFEMDTWQGFMAPAGTPAAIVERMNAEVGRALAAPEVKRSLAEQGAYSAWSSPKEYEKLFQGEVARYRTMVRQLGITNE